MNRYQRLARECIEVGVKLTRRANGTVYADGLDRLSAESRDLLRTVPGSGAKVLRELESLRVEPVEWPAPTPASSYAVRVIRPDGLAVWIATDERAAAAVKREAASEAVLLAVEVLKAGELADWETILLARRVFPDARIVAEADRDRIATSRENETPRALRAAGAKT